VKTVDLSKYVTVGRLGTNYYSQTGIVLKSRETGQNAARWLGVKDMVGEEILIEVPSGFGKAHEDFLGGLFDTLIRRQGLDKTVTLVSTTNDAMRESLSHYWEVKKNKIRELEAKKEKEASLGQWAKPMQFFVPDIGTIVRLTQDWTFRLHSESRNYDMFQLVGLPYSADQSISPAWGRHRGTKGPTEVTFKAGTVLKIDRVYIRKGVSDYSSITFNIVKGKNSVLTAGKLEHVFKAKGARFWAKLSDVNKMVVEVDTATLAEN